MNKKKTKAQKRFLKEVRKIVDYSAKRKMTAYKRCEQTAFSILVLLDGGIPNYPACEVIPNHPPSKNISGNLHSNFFSIK